MAAATGLSGLVACSDDAAPSPTDRITSYVTRVAAGYGFELEGSCVRALVAGIPDPDLEILLRATTDNSPNPTLPELSTSGNAFSSRLSECQITVHNTNAALIERALEAASTDLDGAILDQACAREALSRFDDAALSRLADLAPGSTEPRLGAVTSALFSCLQFPAS